jgi:hypothetical protein
MVMPGSVSEVERVSECKSGTRSCSAPFVATAHISRATAVFDRYNIVNEEELLTAGERLAAYVTRHVSAKQKASA